MNIKIKAIKIENFKGFVNFKGDFDSNIVEVKGKNGTGKSTTFDAFTFCLFGKNANDNMQFSIRHINENGDIEPEKNPSVTITLNIDGKDKIFTRELKARFDQDEDGNKIYIGNDSIFWIDGLKMKKSDYDKEVESILPTRLFKLITNPFYFNSLKDEEKKEILLGMIEMPTDEELANADTKFADLLKEMNGDDINIYRQKIASRKQEVKKENEELEISIKTLNNSIQEYVSYDFASYEKEKQEKEEILKGIEENITDENKRHEDVIKKMKEKANVANGYEKKLKQIKENYRQNIISNNNNIELNIEELNKKVESLGRDKKDEEIRLERCNKDIESFKNTLANKEEQKKQLLETYYGIKELEVVFDDNSFCCPVSKQHCDIIDTQEKRDEYVAKFNKDKSDKLTANITQGKKIAEEIKQYKEWIQQAEEKRNASINIIAEKENSIKDTLSNIEEKKKGIKIEPTEEEIQSYCNRDIDYQETQVLFDKAKEECNNIETPATTQELKEQQQVLKENIEELVKNIHYKDIIEETKTKIKEIEDKEKHNAQYLATLEGQEFKAFEFQKMKDNELMNRINSLFKIVSFNFIDNKFNGNEKIVCNCLINNVPYADCNTASQINGGIDIINAISKIQGVTAPIFVDRAESINKIIDSESQLITLIVSEDNQLLIIKK